MLSFIFDTLMGIIAGVLFYIISVIQISKRVSDSEIIIKIKNKSTAAIYTVLSMILFVLVGTVVSNPHEKYEIMFLYSICLCIGWIDLIIKKIPNELLIALIIIKTAFIIMRWNSDLFLQSILGLIIGLVVFMAPSIFGITIGAGDIKYAAAVGFYLGLYSFFESMLIMAAFLLFYLIYLYITKKGNLKTSAAIGPYISVGVMITVLFPIV